MMENQVERETRREAKRREENEEQTKKTENDVDVVRLVLTFRPCCTLYGSYSSPAISFASSPHPPEPLPPLFASLNLLLHQIFLNPAIVEVNDSQHLLRHQDALDRFLDARATLEAGAGRFIETVVVGKLAVERLFAPTEADWIRMNDV